VRIALLLLLARLALYITKLYNCTSSIRNHKATKSPSGISTRRAFSRDYYLGQFFVFDALGLYIAEALALGFFVIREVAFEPDHLGVTFEG
jgi:hypothetical protein